MTEPSPASKRDAPASKRDAPGTDKPRRSTWVLVLFAGSATLSLLIFAVGASKSVSAVSNNEPAASGAANVTTVSASSVSGDQVRAAAKTADQRLLNRVRRRPEFRPSIRNAAAARASWEREVREIRQQLKGVREFPPGSIAWHRREALKEMLEDAPPQSP